MTPTWVFFQLGCTLLRIDSSVLLHLHLWNRLLVSDLAQIHWQVIGLEMVRNILEKYQPKYRRSAKHLQWYSKMRPKPKC